jgi:hypothetical protein
MLKHSGHKRSEKTIRISAISRTALTIQQSRLCGAG